MVDRTLAERAREAADDAYAHRETRELLTALADENDTLRAQLDAWTDMTDPLVPESLICAQRDRYWNLAVQLADLLSRLGQWDVMSTPSGDGDVYWRHEIDSALAAFRAEKESRDV